MRIRIFDRYIWGQVFSSTLTGVLVLTGVMVLGSVYQKLDQLLGDTKVPITVVLKFIGLTIPYSLIFTLPCAFLTGILLVFGRMSADNEMVSLRMTGQPMWRICMPIFIMAALLCSVCLYVNLSLAPMAKNSVKHMFYDIATSDPINLFPEGRVLDKMPGYRIYTQHHKSHDTLENLQIIKLDGNRAVQFIRARTAKIERKPGELDFTLRLKDANQEMPVVAESGAVENVRSPAMGETELPFPLSDLKNKIERVNAGMKSTSDLMAESSTGIDSATKEDVGRKGKSVARTEVSKRFSFSFACLAFCLVGIPLGITAQRRETTIGFILSLATAISYFVLIMVADMWNEKPSVFPHLLMWIPNVLFLGIGARLFLKLSRK